MRIWLCKIYNFTKWLLFWQSTPEKALLTITASFTFSFSQSVCCGSLRVWSSLVIPYGQTNAPLQTADASYVLKHSQPKYGLRSVQRLVRTDHCWTPPLSRNPGVALWFFNEEPQFLSPRHICLEWSLYQTGILGERTRSVLRRRRKKWIQESRWEF